MKRIIVLTLTLIYFGTLSGYAQMFPKVSKAKSDDMSMLALQFASDENGGLTNVVNANWSMWIPAVTDSDGNLVEFRHFGAGSDVNNIYYAENLEAGEYTLTGFYHIYSDYGKLEEYKKERGESYLAEKAPYKNLPYHVKQHITITEPVKVNLGADKMMSLGSYAVKFMYVGGVGGTTDDRWKTIEQETMITMEEPNNDFILSYMKPWATKKWKVWNAKNPAEKLNN